MRRQQIYRFINEFRTRRGYSPSIRDVCRGVGIKSTSNVWYHFRNMERDGLLKRQQGVSRSVVVVAQFRQTKALTGGGVQGGKTNKGNAK